MPTTFEQTTLKTSRLLLRPLQQSDAATIFALRSNLDVTRYVGYTRWTSIERAYELIEKDILAMSAGEYLRFGLVRLDDASLIGTCLLYDLDTQCRRAEIGYDLLPDMWGQGFIHEALLSLLQFGFTELGLNRVEADVDPDNAGSIKTLERLGFQREGYLRERWIVNGVKFDTVYYGLLLSEWEARQGV
jgi:ribosomal-protein-alanine N-acetyltransferase